MALMGGLARGLQAGATIGTEIANTKTKQALVDHNYLLKQRALAQEQANKDRNFDLAKKRFDLTAELQGLQIKAVKSKTFSRKAQYVSHMIRSAMEVPDGSRPLTNQEFDALPADEKLRRMDIIDRGAQFFVNQGELGKMFLSAHPDIDPKRPVKNFELMQNSQGEKGMLVNLNRKDGKPASLDYPQRRTGEATVLPIGAFSRTLWNLSGAFGGDDLSKRQEIILRNKGAAGLEKLRHINRMEEISNKPQAKTELRRNVEFLLSSGAAKTPSDALKVLQRAKSNPTRLVMDMVKSTEENQMLMNVRPGDPNYKDRSQIISDALSLIDQISGRTQYSPQDGSRLPAEAAAQLREGVVTQFGNGQSWTLRNGQPVQVQ